MPGTGKGFRTTTQWFLELITRPRIFVVWPDYLSPLQTREVDTFGKVVGVEWCDVVKKSGQERGMLMLFLEGHLRGDRCSIAQGGGGGLFVRDNKK